MKTVCKRPRLVLKSKQRVRHGRSVVVHGLLRTAQGLPIGGAPVRVLGAPNNGSHAFFPLTTATTDANGLWSAKVPAGPSRIIAGVFDGSATLQPAIGKARTIVPAAVKLIRVTPRRIAWGGTVKIVGQLRGGYLPAAGALVRLRIGYGKAFVTYGVKEHVRGQWAVHDHLPVRRGRRARSTVATGSRSPRCRPATTRMPRLGAERSGCSSAGIRGLHGTATTSGATKTRYRNPVADRQARWLAGLAST